jgi:hypothetical protein
VTGPDEAMVVVIGNFNYEEIESIHILEFIFTAQNKVICNGVNVRATYKPGSTWICEYSLENEWPWPDRPELPKLDE